MSDLRLIKRYANRKMYDTGTSKYITLDEIALLVDEGIDLQIIDNDTKDDLTEVTLAQILVERSRRGKLEHSVTSLRGMIKNTGEQFTKKISEPVVQLRSSMEESVNRLIRTGEERAAGTRDQVQGWIQQNTQAIEDIQKKVDERIRLTAGRFDILSTMKTQLEALEERVADLEEKLEKRG
ncbi:MAG: polyhydroxyalkanoate synthesis regulator DNA-binding domain-containing protein [Myxococcota bacterium]|nr:polyhydroxyalkanoate synthesis regulator DNA-binding domain-containing protein [Myxococcota bacterium]